MNPFLINTRPIDRLSALLHREEEIARLRAHINDRKQTIILGPEGVGKSSLLRSTFDREYRIEQAKNQTLITSVTEFPADLKDGDTLYIHFAEMIIGAVEILEQCGETELMNRILLGCNNLRDAALPPETYFQKIVTRIHDFGYQIVMVVDNFERFTSSAEVNKNHHGILLSLLDFLQFIATTNYDLNQDSLPPAIADSYLLTRFVGNEIRVGGWSREATYDFLTSKLSSSDISFSNTLLETLYDITGGVPKILNIAANYAYDYIAKNGSENGLKLISPLYENDMVSSILFHWCTMLQPRQIDALKYLLENENDCETYKEILRVLYMRGILNYKVTKDVLGNINVSDNDYIFCGELFAYFCSIDGNLELAASKNQLNKIRSTATAEPAKNLDSAKAGAINSAELKFKKLNDAINTAAANADDEINEYKNLGKRPVSKNSGRMLRLTRKAEEITNLKIALDAKFEIIFDQIESSSSSEQLMSIKSTLENTCWEIEQALDALLNGV